jgi:hypothetical protein
VPARYLDAFISIRRIDRRPELARVTGPVTVVRGLRDQARLPGRAAELAAGTGDSELAASDSGRSSPPEDPAAVQRAPAGLAARVAAAGRCR